MTAPVLPATVAGFEQLREGFNAWLRARGSGIVATKGSHEVCRFPTPSGVGIIYRNGKNCLSSWARGADKALLAYLGDQPWQIGQRGIAETRDANPAGGITIYTDAGVCTKTKTGVYAVWWKTGGVSGTASGRLKGPTTDSNIAELQAIANGLWRVCEILRPAAGTRIWVRSDSKTAISLLSGAVRPNPKSRKAAQIAFCAALAVVREFIEERGLVVSWGWVKGHAGGRTPQSWVNTECDRLCRAEIQRARRAAAALRCQGATELTM